MTDGSSDDRQASELLRSLERDRSRVSSRRDNIREQVLDHYDQLRRLQTETGGDGDSDLVIQLESAKGPGQPSTRGLGFWLAAAAAAAIVAVGAWLVVSDDRMALDTASPQDVPTTTTDIGSDTTQTTEAPEIAPLAELSLASGEIVFNLPDGLVLVDRQEGLLVFGRDENAAGIAETILAVEVDSTDLRTRLTELVRSGSVDIGTTGTLRVGGQEFTTWSVNPERADADSTCGAPGGCVQFLPEVEESAIPVGVRVSVDELVTSSEMAVVVISNADDGLGTTALLEMTEIS